MTTLIQTASLQSVASVVALFPNEEHRQVLGNRDFSTTSHRNSGHLMTLQDEKMALGRWRVAMKVPIARKLCVPSQSQIYLSSGRHPSGQCLLTSDSIPREAAITLQRGMVPRRPRLENSRGRV